MMGVSRRDTGGCVNHRAALIAARRKARPSADLAGCSRAGDGVVCRGYVARGRTCGARTSCLWRVVVGLHLLHRHLVCAAVPGCVVGHEAIGADASVGGRCRLRSGCGRLGCFGVCITLSRNGRAVCRHLVLSGHADPRDNRCAIGAASVTLVDRNAMIKSWYGCGAGR